MTVLQRFMKEKQPYRPNYLTSETFQQDLTASHPQCLVLLGLRDGNLLSRDRHLLMFALDSIA